MKKIAVGILGVLTVACCATLVLAQGNPRGTSTLTIRGKRFRLITDGPRSRVAQRMQCWAN